MAELPASHAQYHLRVLEKNALILSQRQEGNLRYYPTKTTPLGDLPSLSPADRELLQLLRRPTVFGILANLLADGALSLTDLARRCGVTPSTMSYHLDRLQERALVVRDESNVLWRLQDAQRVRALLVAHEPPPALVAGFLDVWQRLAP